MATFDLPSAELVQSMAVRHGSQSIGDGRVPRYIAGELLLTPYTPQGIFSGMANSEQVVNQAKAILRVPLEVVDYGDSDPKPAPLQTIRVRATAPAASYSGRDFVRWATDTINLATLRQRSLQRGPQANAPLHLHAMPNWLISSAQGWIHGPGTEPGPGDEDTGGGDRPIVVPQAAGWVGKDSTHKVIVCVLDSAPDNPLAALDGFPGNARMNELRGKIASFQTFPLPPVGLHSFAQPDHGIFVAGIINSIAPHAGIHLMRVLNETGCGDTGSILKALSHCADLARTLDLRVVVNLSTYMLIPPDDVPAPFRLDNFWFSGVGFTPPPIAERNALIAQLAGAVTQAMDALLAANVVVVAAAGNDALGCAHDFGASDPIHLQPRLPADYDRILCVVATDGDHRRIAKYSNQADLSTDLLEPTNSIATWGGQGERAKKPGGGEYPDEVDVPDPGRGRRRDAISGAYTARTVERGSLPSMPNDTGWVYWSGTSFATPIISGIAANLLAKNPALTPDEVKQQIQSDPISQPPGPGQDFGCRYVRATQA